MAGHSSLNGARARTDGSDKALSHSSDLNACQVAPTSVVCARCSLGLFLFQAQVKYLKLVFPFFCFDLLRVPDGEGFTVSKSVW